MTGAELSTMVEKAADKQFQQGIFPYCLGVDELLEARTWITPLFLRDTDRILKIEISPKGLLLPPVPPMIRFMHLKTNRSGVSQLILILVRTFLLLSQVF
jgi:hypothetical protein